MIKHRITTAFRHLYIYVCYALAISGGIIVFAAAQTFAPASDLDAVTYYYKGTIGDKAAFVMRLTHRQSPTNPDKVMLTGDYRYTDKADWISVAGSYEAGELNLGEYEGSDTTHFKAKFKGEFNAGNWLPIGKKKKALPYTIEAFTAVVQPDYNYSIVQFQKKGLPRKQLIIKDISTTKTVQILDLDINSGQAERLDMNFDGYLDMRVAMGDTVISGALNTFYHHYLYNPKTQKLVKDKALNSMKNATFDPQTATATTNWIANDSNYDTDTYQYENGAYSLTQRVERNNIDAKNIKEVTILYKTVKNKLKEVGRKTVLVKSQL